MTQGFNAYIKTIAVFLIFITFAEMIAPDGGVKRYISVALGALAAVSLIQPALEILGAGAPDISEYISWEAGDGGIVKDYSEYEQLRQQISSESYIGEQD